MNEVLKRQRRKTMSQKKVDKYKNNKYSLLVGWIGYSAYAKIQAKEASVKVDTVMDTSALTDYISGLSSDSAE